MDRTLIKKYIDNQPKKVVAKMDLGKNKIEYQSYVTSWIVSAEKQDVYKRQPFPIPFLSGTFPQENPAENISDRKGMDKILSLIHIFSQYRNLLPE